MAFDGSVASYGSFVEQMLPRGWLDPESNPTDAAIIQAMAANPSAIWALLEGVQQQSRVGTATGSFLDLAAQDYFGAGEFPRRSGEPDASYRARIKSEILRPRVTRAALVSAVQALTGVTPLILEPNNPQDTLTWGGMFYGLDGCWASNSLHYQFFVTVYNPPVAGGVNVPGWGGGFYSETLSYQAAPASLSAAEIYQTITRTLPAGVTAWTQILPSATAASG